jgi:phenylacetate-CoA ligase
LRADSLLISAGMIFEIFDYLMSFNFKRGFYESLPPAIKKSVCFIPFSWLAGKTYRDAYNRGPWFDRANSDDIHNYKERKLGEILQFAVRQVPAYEKFRNVVERYKPFEALQAFPFLDKDTIQVDLLKYLPHNFESIPHYETTTGGTSGNQLKIYLDDCSQSVDMGFMHRQWNRVGYTPDQRKATFRGVPFRNLKPGIHWQHNQIYNELQFSPFHMSENNLDSYVREIIRFSPTYLHGYPSSIDVLAEYVLRNNLTKELPPIRAALLGSEGFHKGQRDRIEQAFHTRVYSWYGHSERLVLAGECEKNNTYHHFPDYGIMEIIDEQGTPRNKEGERGEIVGTGLLNRCMPLIRYRTGDYATRQESRCGCGRYWDRFCDVEGHRKQDMVIGRSGTKMSLAALNMHGPLFEHVKRYQYFQEEAGSCTINIMPNPLFKDSDRIAIEKAYQAKTGEEITWNVNQVDDIPLTERGKLRLLLSSIKESS